MNASTLTIGTITTRYQDGSYVATVAGHDVARSHLSSHKAAQKAAGDSNHVKEINPGVFRAIPKTPQRTKEQP